MRCAATRVTIRSASASVEPTTTTMSLLSTVDWVVIAAYFVVLYAVVFRHSAANRKNPTEFFLAGRNAGWFIVEPV